MPHEVLNSKAYPSLTPAAVKLLLDLGAQYRGTNNGDLCAAWTVMAKRGWRSKATLTRALRELEGKGFICKTRQGGRHRASLYAVTWRPIDECGGKLEVRATRTAPGYWRLGYNPELNPLPHIRTTLTQ